MSRIKQKTVFDAGIKSSPSISEEINDQNGRYSSTPQSNFSIGETSILSFTNRVVGQNYSTFADGYQRPGTAS